MPRFLLVFALFAAAIGQAAPEIEDSPATHAINQFGLDLVRLLAKEKPDENLLISSYALQSAFALAYAGAEGATKEEMAKILSFPADNALLAKSFTTLRTGFFSNAAIELRVANRIYSQTGLPLSDTYLSKIKDDYQATMLPVDFLHDTEATRNTINQWVTEQTAQRITDLIPQGGLDSSTSMVLVNALYYKAGWDSPFEEDATRPRAFHLKNESAPEVPTMHKSSSHFSYARFNDFVAVTVPYSEDTFQLVILLPDESSDPNKILSELTDKKLRTIAARSSSASKSLRQIDLFLPRFKLEGPTLSLAGELRTLGMKNPFNVPPQSADFSGILPNSKRGDFFLSKIFHKTYLSLDENGTEAAASTAVALQTLGVMSSPKRPPPPIIVHVDHPFIVAIQHVQSGACLFLGIVRDPR